MTQTKLSARDYYSYCANTQTFLFLVTCNFYHLFILFINVALVVSINFQSLFAIKAIALLHFTVYLCSILNCTYNASNKNLRSQQEGRNLERDEFFKDCKQHFQALNL